MNAQFIQSRALNTSFNSSPQLIVDSSLYAVQAVFSGATCSFSCKIQVSSDAFNIPGGPVNWDDLANSSQTFTTAGSFTWSVSQAGYEWVRLVITDNSGGTNTGTISATINTKGDL